MVNDGILLIDKQFGLSSQEAVSRVKKILGLKKAGHAGTLDPYATGLLIVTLGKATKLSTYLGNQRKKYVAAVKLGEERASFDRFSRIIARHEVTINEADLRAALGCFLGESNQLIPSYSAAHHEGNRMYEYARQGIEIPPHYKKVNIFEINLKQFDPPLISLEIECSQGTYIRSLAHQLGQKLGCGAHLFALTRTSIGRFRIADAISLVQLEALAKLKLVDGHILPLHGALDLPLVIVADPKTEGVRNGQEILPDDLCGTDQEFFEGDLIGVENCSGSLLAIGRACVSSEKLRGQISERFRVFDYQRVI